MFAFLRNFASPGSDAVSFVDAATVRQWQKDKTAVIVDVREPAEYAGGHIPGAVSMPLSRFDASRIPALAEGQHLVVHCQAGVRCGAASRLLLAAGFQGSINRLRGGFMAWLSAGGAVAR